MTVPPEAITAELMERCDTEYRATEGKRALRRGLLAALKIAYGSGLADGAAAERASIRRLAERTGAVCTADEGTQHYFADLLRGDQP